MRAGRFDIGSLDTYHQAVGLYGFGIVSFIAQKLKNC